MTDLTRSGDRLTAVLGGAYAADDTFQVRGLFSATFQDEHGKILRQENFRNTLMIKGKDLLLDSTFGGVTATQVTYMGLISSASYSAISNADTMVSHAGWLESGGANAPTMSDTRLTTVWSASATGQKALTTGLTFHFTGTGTVTGAFLVGGTGASATLANTGGTLFAAGTLGTAQPVINANTLTLSYSVTLS